MEDPQTKYLLNGTCSFFLDSYFEGAQTNFMQGNVFKSICLSVYIGSVINKHMDAIVSDTVNYQPVHILLKCSFLMIICYFHV